MKEDTINKNPEAVQEFVTDLIDSGRFAEEQPQKAAEIGANFLNSDKDLLHSILTEPKDRIITSNLKPNADDFDTIQNYMHDKMGVLKGKIDIDRFIDLRFSIQAT
jgi:ABC-type nitrate/sulfonate/bicarbonate transport system substrate-binding protein